MPIIVWEESIWPCSPMIRHHLYYLRVELTVNDEGQIYLAGLLKDLGLSASAGQARRDIDGGGVKINGEAVAPKSYNIDPSALKLGDTLSVGKRKGFKLI